MAKVILGGENKSRICPGDGGKKEKKTKTEREDDEDEVEEKKLFLIFNVRLHKAVLISFFP